KAKSKRSTIWISKICAFFSKSIPTKIICCADQALLVHQKMGYDKSKLVRVWNGFDLGIFCQNLNARSSVRSQIGISTDTFLLGTVGRYDPQKDHVNLLKALSIISSAGYPVHCLLVGRGLS